MPNAAQPSREAALQALFEALQPLSLAPLWTQYRAMLTPTPQGTARPYLWRYAELRPHLLRTGEVAALPESAATPYDDLLLEYTNPYTGDPVLPTMGCTAQYLRPGAHTQAHRQASSSVYMVLEGAGWSVIEGQRFDWTQGDVFAIPA